MHWNKEQDMCISEMCCWNCSGVIFLRFQLRYWKVLYFCGWKLRYWWVYGPCAVVFRLYGFDAVEEHLSWVPILENGYPKRLSSQVELQFVRFFHPFLQFKCLAAVVRQVNRFCCDVVGFREPFSNVLKQFVSQPIVWASKAFLYTFRYTNFIHGHFMLLSTDLNGNGFVDVFCLFNHLVAVEPIYPAVLFR